MAEDKHDKIFDPTPRRLMKAREEGNVFRAKEMVTLGMLVTGLILIFSGMPALKTMFRSISHGLMHQAMTSDLDSSAIEGIVQNITIEVIYLLSPFLLALFIAAVVFNLIPGGWNFSLKPLMPKPDRVSPVKGLGRIFSPKSLFDLFKSMSKIAIVGPIAWFSITGHFDEMMHLPQLPLDLVLEKISTWIFLLVVRLVVVLGVLTAIDFFYQSWQHNEDLKMSFKEIQDENKEMQGDPQVKGKRKQLAAEMSRRARLDHAVLQADVVITNPTHYAVALAYNPAEGAPKVLAKGIRKRALRIKELAAEFEVPMIENRPLARALFASVDEGNEIPQDMYAAIAAILAEIYKARRDRGSRIGNPVLDREMR